MLALRDGERDSFNILLAFHSALRNESDSKLMLSFGLSKHTQDSTRGKEE